MGNVIYFAHFVSSARCRAPKTLGSTRNPSRSNRFENIRNQPAGIRRRARQLETAETPTPAMEAAAVEPPTASMILSTDANRNRMQDEYSQNVNESSVHKSAMELNSDLLKDEAMQKQAEIAQRLADTIEALGKIPAQVAKRLKCTPSHVTMWTTSGAKDSRIIPTRWAVKFCDEYGVTLDWIFRGLPTSHISDELRTNIQKIEDARDAAHNIKKFPPRRQRK